jgi:hypothetical protein
VRRASHIIGPAADWAHLILAPLWALGLGLLVGLSPLGKGKVSAFGLSASPADAFIGAFIMAHLVLVFARSHVNAGIRERHPYRFFVVPPLLLAVLLASPLARSCAIVLAVWWDAYHSSLQTFGIGRMLDMKAGNDPEAGRRLDWMLNVLLYIGPILSGGLLLYHSSSFYEFDRTGLSVLTRIPPFMTQSQSVIRWLLLAVTLPFLAYYAWSYAVLAKKGYIVDRRKVILYASTALCSLYAWGFNPLGMGLFIMNFFHAWQYYALVWRYEGESVAAAAGLKGGLASLALLLGAGFAYGVVFGFLGELREWALCVTLVVSLMHFWYDGFIWSVRAKQV